MAKKHNKNAKSKFIQNGRLGTHLTNVNASSPQGYRMPGFSEVHHILCHSCVQDAAILVAGVDKDYIRKCLAITEWDVNNPKNLIGLPKKWAYVVDYAGHTGWDKLPCHQHDHARFTEGVKQWLKDNVWTLLKGREKECDVEPKDLKSVLDNGSKRWQKFLLKRGAEQGGTKFCWDERHKSMTDKWYIPFSMSPSGIPSRYAAPAGISTVVGRIMRIIG